MNVTENFSLAPPEPYFARVAEEEGWFDDSRRNYQMGWGRGLEGQVRARQELLETLSKGFLVAYKRGRPVGWVDISHDNSSREVYIRRFYLAPEESLVETGREIMRLFLDRAFKAGAYRVCATPLAVDVNGRKFWKGMGFESEGKIRAKVWMDETPFGVAVFSILAPEWKQQKRESAEE